MTGLRSPHPYADLPDHCFWSRSVSLVAPGQLDPVVSAPFKITPQMKVATLGSCFAQHIARHLSRSGLNYFVAESAPDAMSAEDAEARQYGLFSARYGNVYTVRQALQLFDRAYGHFNPIEQVWTDGERFIDPFRPTVEPGGFDSPESVLAGAVEHLGAVRQVFEQADVIVFTLGLTEAWVSREDGTVFAMAPGVAGGHFVPEQYANRTFSSQEVRADLKALCERIRSVNPQARVLLTVSPVPLIATHREDQHVITATAYSKAVLRIAAEEVSMEMESVSYFPSYEIITSAHSRGSYFEPDLRGVRDTGVKHVMRVFSRHFIEQDSAEQWPRFNMELAPSNEEIVCDEEMIEQTLKSSGFSS